jgi:hypothetical protein
MTPAARAGVILSAQTSEPARDASLARQSALPGRRSLLTVVPVYWHLLSIDAPTVAVVWAWSFARVAHLATPVAEIAVLGIGTWLIYVLDRILDARILTAGPAANLDHLRERHFFHARHRRTLLLACGLAALPLLWLVVTQMSPAARRGDAILFSASVLYFALVHVPGFRIPRIRGHRRFPREVVVGVIFALASAVPVWAHSPAGHFQPVAPVLLFAVLCSVNCLAIESWERPIAVPRNGSVPVLAACLAAGAVFVMVTTGYTRVSGSILAAALLLLALDCDHRSDLESGDRAFTPLALRIAADAVLLTPVLLVLPCHG